MNVYVYIDGFNVYYRRVRNTPYKWLDFGALCLRLFPNDQIGKIRYFTAKVKNDPSDQNKRKRQMTYVRALRTVPNLEVHYGQFVSHAVWRRMAPKQSITQEDQCNQCGFAGLCCIPNALLDGVKIIDTKEKASDVNLASFLLYEGFHRQYDMAAVITSDSDFVTPVKMVRDDLNIPIRVINPSTRPADVLRKAASSYYILRTSDLKTCQFPNRLTDGRGMISKPSTW